jgi:serine/threonine protein phosphatase PrpC
MTAQTRTLKDWRFAVGTDVGRQRDHNEDATGFFVNGANDLLLAVCDGMGGHAAGDVASRGAVEIVRRHFSAAAAGADPRSVLFDALVDANDQILTQGQSNAERKGMGTTAAVVWLRGREAWVAHVGDSRVYQLRGGATVFRTVDHTKVQKMVAHGILTPEQAASHPDANVVLRALGHMPPGGRDPEKRPEVTNAPLKLSKGDALVLCSDGLFDLVSEFDIAKTLVGRTASQATDELIRLANERGGHDNISVAVLVHGQDVPGWEAARPPPPPKAPRRTVLDLPGASAPGRMPGGAAVARSVPPWMWAVAVGGGPARVAVSPGPCAKGSEGRRIRAAPPSRSARGGPGRRPPRTGARRGADRACRTKAADSRA